MNEIALPIATPPWTANGRYLESRVRKAIHDFDLLENKDHIAVALSGGKDSLTLLYMLNALSGRGFPPFKISAIHIGGEFSCGASIHLGFIQSVCASLNIPLIVREEITPPTECYSCSRRRRTLLFEEARRIGADIVAFGHHRDDCIQTLLMNLLHKGEFEGNLPKVPMFDYGVTIIRPLIYISEKEVVEFAKHYGFYRITCQCPIGQNSVRKKTASLIEQLERVFPHARLNLAHASLRQGSQKAKENPHAKR